MANFWEEDEIVQPAASGNPWEQDEIVSETASAPSQPMVTGTDQLGQQVQVGQVPGAELSPQDQAISSREAVTSSDPALQEHGQRQLASEQEAVTRGYEQAAAEQRNREFSRSLDSQVDNFLNYDIINDTGIGPALTGGRKVQIVPKQDNETLGNIIAGGIGSIYNIPSNLAETGLAIRDVAAKQLGGVESNTAEEFAQWEKAPRYKADSTAGSLVQGMVEMGVGGTAGYKLADAAIKNSPKGIAALAKLFGSSVGAVSTAHPDQEGFLVGDEAIGGGRSIGGAMGLGQEGSEGILRDKLDLVADSMITGAAVNGIANAAVSGFNVVKDLTVSRIVRFFNSDAQKDEAFLRVITEVADIKPDMPEEEIYKRIQDVSDYVREHPDLAKKFFGPLSPEEVAQLSPAERAALQGKRDVVSILESGADDLGIDTVRAKQLRTGAQKLHNTDVSPLQRAMSEPDRVAGEYFDTSIREAGGEAGMKKTGEAIQEGAEKLAQRQEAKIERHTGALERRKAQANELLENDPEIGSRVRDLIGADIDVGGPRREAANAVRDKVRTIKGEQDAQLKKLSDAIPEDTQLDWDGIAEILQNPNIKSALGKDYEMIALAADEGMGGGSVIRLTPKISQAIDKASRSNDRMVSDELRALRDIINNPLDEAPELDALRSYYKDTWAPNWRDGKLGDFADSYVRTTGRGIKDVTADVEQRNIIKSAIQEPEYVEQLKQAGVDDKSIQDAIFGDALAAAKKEVTKKGKLTYDDLDGIVNSLSNSEGLAAYPELQKSISEFATQIRDKKITLEAAEKRLAEYTRDSEKAIGEIFSKRFAEFFGEKVPGQKRGAASTNLDLSFNKLFTDPNNASKIDDIIQILDKSNDPIMNRKGLQAAYLKMLREHSYGPGEDLFGQQIAKTGVQKKEALGRSQFEEYGKKIFSDRPAAFKVAMEVLDESARLRRAGQAAAREPDRSEASKGFRSFYDMVITMVAGPLSRTGARARSLGARMIDRYHPDDNINQFTIQILSDDGEFNRLAQKWLSNNAPSKLSAQDVRDIIRWGIESGLREPKDKAVLESMTGQKENDTDDQTNKILNGNSK